MANVSVTITASQADATRIITMLRARVSLPGGDAMGDAAFFKACVMRYLMDAVRDYERQKAQEQAASGVADVTIT